jgi:membrane protease YdiL (CAAX protease family)
MSDLEKASPRVQTSPAPSRTWGFLETTLVALLADGAFMMGGLALALGVGLYAGFKGLSLADINAMWPAGRSQGACLIVGSLPAIAVLWVAIRMAGREFAEYLALKWPAWRELVRAFAVMAIVVLAESFVSYLVGAELPITDSYRAVGGPGGLFILLIGGCIAAPVVEELVVRGFMFRGWSKSFLGPIGAIVLTSAVWAMNHTQYDLFARLQIFVMGLVLGHIRWRSDSTWLTVMVHSTLNISIFATIGPYV